MLNSYYVLISNEGSYDYLYTSSNLDSPGIDLNFIETQLSRKGHLGPFETEKAAIESWQMLGRKILTKYNKENGRWEIIS